MRTIGFAGTAKNTGKTTAARYVASDAFKHGLRCAFTSIGFDGENRDTVTGLPKPRYLLQPGMLAATAESCLKACTAKMEILQPTGVHTALGEVLITKVLSPGLVLLAGANKTADTLQVLEILRQHQVDLCVLDGALNRLVPLQAADLLCFSTGAALDEHIPLVAEHAGALALLHQPAVSSATPPSTIALQSASQNWQTVGCSSSLIDAESLQQLRQAIDQSPRPILGLSIPGACFPSLLKSLISVSGDTLAQVEVIFGSPLKLIASGSPLHWKEVFSLLANRGATTAYQYKSPVSLLTVNPFYPRLVRDSFMYEPAYVDKTDLLEQTTHAVHIYAPNWTVCDLFQPQVPDLLSILGIMPS